MNRASRSASLARKSTLASVMVTGLVAALAFSAAAPAQPQAPKAPVRVRGRREGRPLELQGPEGHDLHGRGRQRSVLRDRHQVHADMDTRSRNVRPQAGTGRLALHSDRRLHTPREGRPVHDHEGRHLRMAAQAEQVAV